MQDVSTKIGVWFVRSQLYPTIAYRAIALPRYIVSCPIMSYHSILYNVTSSYHIVSIHVISHD